MKIYVQSAGFSQERDYSWQEITKNKQKPIEEPDWVQENKDLLQTETHSIFLGRESNNLILLVTGMKASKRKDYRGRTIRNSIALIAQDNEENEQKIRGIAVLALEGKLENEIDSAIKEGGEYEFAVSYQTIENTIKASLQTKNSTGTKQVMIGKNSEDNRKIIADELKEYRLPQKSSAYASEALVVVTGIKKEDDLKKAGVWRGLSNLVEKEDLSPYEYNFFSSSGQSKKVNPQWAIRLIILLGGGGAAIWFALWFLWGPIQSFIFGANPTNTTTVVLASISPSGQYFATTDPDGKVLVKSTQDQTIKTIEVQDEDQIAPITSVAISSNGNYVVTGDKTGKVQLWDVNNKKKIDLTTNSSNANLRHEKAVLSLGINAFENQETKIKNIKIVSGGADGQVLLWKVNVEDGKAEVSNEKLES